MFSATLMKACQAFLGLTHQECEQDDQNAFWQVRPSQAYVMVNAILCNFLPLDLLTILQKGHVLTPKYLQNPRQRTEEDLLYQYKPKPVFRRHELIVLCGEAGAGKDTLGQLLQEKDGYHILHFADALKEGCKILFDLQDEDVYTAQKDLKDPRYNLTPRYILQVVGTLFRDHSGDFLPIDGRAFWLMRLEQELLRHRQVVICDGRFPNEVQFARDLGGTSFRIDRLLETKVESHSSEEYVRKLEVDCDIDNSRSPLYMYQQLVGFLSLMQ